MIQGLTVTLSIFFITLLLALPLGLMLAFMRLSKNKLIKYI
ncbi:hypothetical protein [[Clostridium] dakarense]|nr:hypothetical protein [[Clostridium] dakarense]